MKRRDVIGGGAPTTLITSLGLELFQKITLTGAIENVNRSHT